jgi:predicted lysophospholipase L1 biosynthesis ABC-type transport system permease subunit
VKKEEAKGSAQVRKVAARAVRRLNVLEYVILAAAAGFAMLAGALAALMLRTAFELPFRPTWIVASLTLFVVPATISYLRARRLEQNAETKDVKPNRGVRRERHGG